MKIKKIVTATILTAAIVFTSNIPILAATTTNATDILKETSVTPRDTYATVNTATSVYEARSTSSKVVFKVPKNASVEIRSTCSDGAWCRIKYDHKIGYIQSAYLNF